MLRQTSVAAIVGLAWALASGPLVAAEETAAKQTVPKRVSAKRACTTAEGETREECEKVAKKIDAQTANPQAHPDADANRTSSQHVHHSSPVMRTPAEVKKAEAASKEAQRQDDVADDRNPGRKR